MLFVTFIFCSQVLNNNISHVITIGISKSKQIKWRWTDHNGPTQKFLKIQKNSIGSWTKFYPYNTKELDADWDI